MIRRLRWKFVLINMALVATVLIIVFTVITIASYRQLRSDGDTAMRIALAWEANMPPQRYQIRLDKIPQNQPDFMPVFSAIVTDAGDALTIDAGRVEISDDLAQEAVSLAMAQEENAGVLSSLNLRYLREALPGITKIAFLDQSVEQASMTRQILNYVFVGFGGLIAFFFISLFLSSWTLRPVEKAWAQQRQFIQDASHELKTPLTVILANLSILQGHGGETIDSQVKWIDNTKQEASRMRKLVDGLLFLARSDASELPREWKAFSLSDAVWRSALSFESVAYEQGISLTSDIEQNISWVGNEDQIVQLIAIFLDNACKYAGSQGQVSVRLQRVQDRISLCFHNTGDVIPPEDLAHIFERFYRADKARARSQGGYGLGLAIAAEIIHHHGGKITAESSAQQGTAFSILLPSHSAGKHQFVGDASRRSKE